MVFELHQIQDWEHLVQTSHSEPVLIFKHSTQCSISDQAYDEFTLVSRQQADLTCGVVLVIEDQNISNTIARELGVRHQSPQAIIVRSGRATWSASHWSITADAISQELKQ